MNPIGTETKRDLQFSAEILHLAGLDEWAAIGRLLNSRIDARQTIPDLSSAFRRPGPDKESAAELLPIVQRGVAVHKDAIDKGGYQRLLQQLNSIIPEAKQNLLFAGKILHLAGCDDWAGIGRLLNSRIDARQTIPDLSSAFRQPPPDRKSAAALLPIVQRGVAVHKDAIDKGGYQRLLEQLQQLV